MCTHKNDRAKVQTCLALMIFFILLLPQHSIADTANQAQSALSAKQVRDYLMGNFDPAKHPAFVKVPLKYANRKGYYLRRATFEAFKRMHAAAKKDGINLIIRSATRSNKYQSWIWNRKWKEKKKKYPKAERRALNILQYSAMPGSSRHHWGTEIDLNSFNNSWFTTGKGKKLFNWLNANAANYGFCRPYTAKNSQRPNGYNEEKWHWSYIPLSHKMLSDAEAVLHDSDVTGFSGSKYAARIGIVKNYVFGVDPSCR